MHNIKRQVGGTARSDSSFSAVPYKYDVLLMRHHGIMART